jgi:hypothetical protein
MEDEMKYAYDKTSNRFIIHVEPDDTPDENYESYLVMFEEHDFKPGVDILISADPGVIVPNIIQAHRIALLVNKQGVRKMAVIAKSADVEEMANAIIPMFSIVKTEYKVFTELQPMFDWINEEEE